MAWYIHIVLYFVLPENNIINYHIFQANVEYLPVSQQLRHLMSLRWNNLFKCEVFDVHTCIEYTFSQNLQKERWFFFLFFCSLAWLSHIVLSTDPIYHIISCFRHTNNPMISLFVYEWQIIQSVCSDSVLKFSCICNEATITNQLFTCSTHPTSNQSN